MEKPHPPEPSFFARLGTALACFSRALGSAEFCRRAAGLLHPAPEPPAPQPAAAPAAPKAAPAPARPEPPSPERLHASGLATLALLQREGRLLDFLQEDMAAYSDAEIGAAARVVHAGCRKALRDHVTLEPALKEAEGAVIQVPAGFDSQRIRLTGNISGQPPFRGSVKHHGWVAASVRLPALSESMDPRILAAAEVEL